MEDKQESLVAVCICRDEQGEQHLPGERFSCSATVASQLIENGSATKEKPAAKVEPTLQAAEEKLKDEQPSDGVKQSEGAQEPDIAEPAGDDADEKTAAITDAIESMLKQDPELNSDVFWNNDGSPKVKQVEKLTKLDVSAADVKKVWAVVEAKTE